MIAIIDHTYSNIKSICNSLTFLNVPYEVISAENLSEKFTKLIIPGVGNFSKTMYNLNNNSGGKEKIFEFSKLKKPIMGICLGMQILASYGEESGSTEGLNLIPGTVKKINTKINEFLPHIGWNSVKIKKTHPVLEGIKNDMDFYFVHSYKFCPSDDEFTIGNHLYRKFQFNSCKRKYYRISISS